MSGGTTIKDPTSGDVLTVDNLGRANTFSVIESEQFFEAKLGDAYNLNTGIVALTDGTVDSAIMYFKNNNPTDYILSALAFGMNTRGGTINDGAVVTMIRNPTAGTIVDDATAISMNQNRNFGSSKTLTADIYKGAQGKTFTDGTDIGIFNLGSGPRLFASIDFILPQGTSLGLKILPECTGAVDVYAALIGFKLRS